MASKQQYLDQVSKNLKAILADNKFSNYIAQLRSLSLGGSFNHSFEESYIWERSFYLTNFGALLILNGDIEDREIGHASIMKAAESFEYLAKVSEMYDAQYVKILSAFCYDISGYQANAFSMLSGLDTYLFQQANEEMLSVENIVLKETNYVVTICVLILQKKLSMARSLNHKNESTSSYLEVFKGAVEIFFAAALTGESNTSSEGLEKAYVESFKSGNTVTNTLINLLNIRLKLFDERSIWKFTEEAPEQNNHIWKRYVKIIANSIYDGNRVKKIENRISRFELWNSQLEALSKGVITSDSSFVLQMPTSAGKTMIAEMAIVDIWAKNQIPTAKILYIAPFRALVSQVERDLFTNLNKLGIRVSSVVGGFEYDIFDDLLLNESDVLITTPEKVEMLLRTNKEYFTNLKLLIFDEGHIIGGDDQRAALSELLVSKLKFIYPNLKKIFISAVISDSNSGQLARWIGGSSDQIAKSPKDLNGNSWSPTRKVLARFEWKNELGNIYYKNINIYNAAKRRNYPVFVSNIIRQEKFRYKNSTTNRTNTLKFPKNYTTKTHTAVLLAYNLSDDGPTLIFCSRADWALNTAKAMNDYFSFLRLSNADIKEQFCNGSSSDSYRVSCEWYGEDHEISRCLYHGVGVHFGKMVKALRYAVENDFKKGVLKVLISTNTIGQGLNFPIKNLIIYSVEIIPQLENYKAISVRDFWNVVGRAGRANKETEGQVIFLVNSRNDFKLYNHYTNEANLEDLESYFVRLIRSHIADRISDVEYLKELNNVSESTLLQLLCEEALGSDIENITNLLVDNSLVGIQLDDDEKLNPYKADLKNSFNTISRDIVEKLDTSKQKIFSETGLPIVVCNNIWSYLELNNGNISTLMANENFDEIIKILIKYLHEFDYELLNQEDLFFIKELPYEFYDKVLELWIAGYSSGIILSYWKNNTDKETNCLTNLISTGFEFILPWLSTGFLKLLQYWYRLILSDEFKLSDDLVSFPTFLKYGADNKYSCLLILLGVNSRELAVKVTDLKQFTSVKSLTDWLGVVNYIELQDFHLSPHEIREIYEVSYKLGGKSYYDIFTNDLMQIQFFIAGISWVEERKIVSSSLRVGDVLTIERDFDNEFDSYAIRVLSNNVQLGFIPREEARFISALIDIEQLNFNLKIVGVVQTAGVWNNIKALLVKV